MRTMTRAGHYKQIHVQGSCTDHLHVSSSAAASPNSLRRHWELDEAPAYYYQNTEGTPEYDRRKAVRFVDHSTIWMIMTKVSRFTIGIPSELSIWVPLLRHAYKKSRRLVDHLCFKRNTSQKRNQQFWNKYRLN